MSCSKSPFLSSFYILNSTRFCCNVLLHSFLFQKHKGQPEEGPQKRSGEIELHYEFNGFFIYKSCACQVMGPGFWMNGSETSGIVRRRLSLSEPSSWIPLSNSDDSSMLKMKSKRTRSICFFLSNDVQENHFTNPLLESYVSVLSVWKSSPKLCLTCQNPVGFN